MRIGIGTVLTTQECVELYGKYGADGKNGEVEYGQQELRHGLHKDEKKEGYPRARIGQNRIDGVLNRVDKRHQDISSNQEYKKGSKIELVLCRTQRAQFRVQRGN